MFTAEEVAISNEWYSTMTDDTEYKHFLQNLKLTQEHLINNTNDSLVSKINQTYYSYPNE
jgi:hypothetical protein